MLYAEHAGRSAIDLDDVKMAIQARVNAEFTGPPPREVDNHNAMYLDFSVDYGRNCRGTKQGAASHGV